MRMRAALVCAVLAASLQCWAATPASFRGRVVEFPVGKTAKDTIYVMSRNGSLRKVEVAGAKIVYSSDVPANERQTEPTKALKHGAEIRVTAEENGAGTWRAQMVEILAPAGMRAKATPLPDGDEAPVPKLQPRPHPASEPSLTRRTA